MTGAAQQTSRSRWTSLLLPYLLAVGCFLASLVRTASIVPTLDVLLWTIVAVISGTLVIHGLAYAIVRRTPLRELVVSEIVIGLGIYGNVKLPITELIPPMIFLVGWLGLFAFLVIATLQIHNDTLIRNCSKNLLVFAAVLLALQFSTVSFAVISDSICIDSLEEHKFYDRLVDARQESDSPDIYYLLLDAYGREDILKELYDFDNGEFLDQLRARGFHVGDNSRSNYHLTELSLASSLNLDYLDKFQLDRFSTRMPLRSLIQNSSTSAMLKSIGYETVAFSSGKVDTECKRFDRYISPKVVLNDFYDGILHRTPLPDLVRPFDSTVYTPADVHRAHITFTLEELQSLKRVNGKPMFVLAHLLSPHPPFVFDAEGNATNDYGHNLLADGVGYLRCHDWSRAQYGRGYTNQLTYLNQQLILTIDKIRERTDGNAIIILQGDHGPRMYSDFTTNSNLREAFGILNAVYVPGSPKISMDLASPVNTFRQIFDYQFGTRFGTLKHRSLYENVTYTFEDVTGRTIHDGKQLNQFALSDSDDALSKAD